VVNVQPRPGLEDSMGKLPPTSYVRRHKKLGGKRATVSFSNVFRSYHMQRLGPKKFVNIFHHSNANNFCSFNA
jgi:hypothetical protein